MIQRVKTDYRSIYFDAASTLGLATGGSFRHGSYVPIILGALPYFVTQKDVLGSSHTSPVPGPETATSPRSPFPSLTGWHLELKIVVGCLAGWLGQ